MKLPRWVLEWLSAYNVNVTSFKAELDRLADKIDAPEEWRRGVSVWLDENATLTPEVVLAFVALVYAEFKSGAPGYNVSHGGLA